MDRQKQLKELKEVGKEVFQREDTRQLLTNAVTNLGSAYAAKRAFRKLVEEDFALTPKNFSRAMLILRFVAQSTAFVAYGGWTMAKRADELKTKPKSAMRVPPAASRRRFA